MARAIISADDIAYPAATAMMALGIKTVSGELFQPDSPVAFYTFRALYVGCTTLHRLQIISAFGIRKAVDQAACYKTFKKMIASSDVAIERACVAAFRERKLVDAGEFRAAIKAEAEAIRVERASVQERFDALVASLPSERKASNPVTRPAQFKPVASEPSVARIPTERKPKSEKHAALDAEIYGTPLKISRRREKITLGDPMPFPGDKEEGASYRLLPEEDTSGPHGERYRRARRSVTLPRIPSLERDLP